MDNDNKSGKSRITDKISRAIVKSRFIICAVFAILSVYCALSVGRVRINTDLTSFLPEDSETRRGVSISEEEFDTYASLQVMIENINFEDASALCEELKKIGNVASVSFDGTEEHYRDGAALFSVSFDGKKNTPEVLEAVSKIKETVSGYENYVFGDADSDYQKQLSGEMTGVLALSGAIIVLVLLFTSKSYFEVVISVIVFTVSALLNMGTNHLLGEISSITHSVAIILQLALAIDYAIIFSHRYQQVAVGEPDVKKAVVQSLSESIREIFSSSLTTVSGLVALMFMQFRFGYDLGIVLSKGIICSMLTVFLLMPGLILLFPGALKRTAHKDLVPPIRKWGNVLTKKVPVFLLILCVIVPLAVYFSGKTEYSFSNGTVSEIVMSDTRRSMHKIYDTFGDSTSLAVIVPSGKYDKEMTVLEKASGLEEVKSVLGLANIEISGGYCLGDKVGAAEISQYLNIEKKQSEMLFRGFALTRGDLGALGDISSYKAPVAELLMFLLDTVDSGAVELTQEQSALLSAYGKDLRRAVRQLLGKKYSRLVITSTLPIEGERSVALIEKVRSIAAEEYGEENVLVIGDMTSARDLRESYKSDSVLISVLTALFVFVIL
ncbi:MAG: MMPL family transporter, partial [Clostridia bacterium]|nr:MMPL family transporter [Clostridia bacterium]